MLLTYSDLQQGAETVLHKPLPRRQRYCSLIKRFYRAMLCIRGTSHEPVSVRVRVCHKSVFN